MEAMTGFGWIEVDGKRYGEDIILFYDGTVEKRKKEKSEKYKEKYGHTPFSKEEVEDLLKKDVEVVYIGTGQFGYLPIMEEAINELKKRGVEIVINITPKVLERIKEDKRKWVALLHVTC